MGITDELREYAKSNGIHCICDYLAIADRIDTEYQKAIRELNNLADDSVLLPVDADGEYIHIGDKVTLYGRCVYEVDGIHFYKNNVSVSYRGENGCGSDSANNFHHYHEPTVEDVLRWLIVSAQALDCIDDEDELVAKYAAKLRLADDGKEQ